MNHFRGASIFLIAALVVACGKKSPDSAAGNASDAALSPLSCSPGGAGMSHCGPAGESCCTSLGVPGGTFRRSYDAVTHRVDTNEATVSPFRLDKFEITVGRFRQFVKAVIAGYRPPPGSGKHAHLNGGAGLNGGKETGWDTAWNVSLAATSSGWNENLACDRVATWTPTPSNEENRPINCIEWYDAYAFCIWDGGFLPTEAEWNYAASGGRAQRVYPWSNPPESTSLDCAYANFNDVELGCEVSAPNDVGSESARGNGLWGQADLAGNVWEWNLDVYDDEYANPCQNCMNLRGGNRVIRGGSFRGSARGAPSQMIASARSSDTATDRFSGVVGARCARAP